MPRKLATLEGPPRAGIMVEAGSMLGMCSDISYVVKSLVAQ